MVGLWRSARVVYRACLENKCVRKGTRGSNPLSSAKSEVVSACQSDDRRNRMPKGTPTANE